MDGNHPSCVAISTVLSPIKQQHMPGTPSLAPLQLERCRSLPRPARKAAGVTAQQKSRRVLHPDHPAPRKGFVRDAGKPDQWVLDPLVSGAARPIHDQRRWGLEPTVSHLSRLCQIRWSCGRAARLSVAVQPQVALLRHTVAIEPAPLRRASAVATGSVAPFPAWHLPSFLPSHSRLPTTPTSHRRAGSPPLLLPRPTSAAPCGAAAPPCPPHHLPLTSHTVKTGGGARAAADTPAGSSIVMARLPPNGGPPSPAPWPPNPYAAPTTGVSDYCSSGASTPPLVASRFEDAAVADPPVEGAAPASTPASSPLPTTVAAADAQPVPQPRASSPPSLTDDGVRPAATEPPDGGGGRPAAPRSPDRKSVV